MPLFFAPTNRESKKKGDMTRGVSELSLLPRVILGLYLALTLAVASASDPSRALDEQVDPVHVKVVVVTMFEIGADEGDRAGEFQLWKERRKLSKVYPFLGYRDLHFDSDTGLMVMVTGIGTARSAAAIMALGMDPRFDFTSAYWVVSGIAGFDPEDASIGSAAWAEYLIDGDLSHEIDAREIPEDWPFGYFARYTKGPFDPNRPPPTGEIYALDLELVNWAYELTKDMKLIDDPGAAKHRALYTDHPKAQKPPFVLKGDQLAALTFWHGAILNDWANQWVDYWTDGKGEFVSSGMEDTGTYLSLSWLTRIGKADVDRLLVLRTASNYTMQPPGVTAAESLLAENEGYSGLGVALESAYRVASKVVDALITGWDEYQHQAPSVSFDASSGNS